MSKAKAQVVSLAAVMYAIHKAITTVTTEYQAGNVQKEKKLLDSTLRCRVELNYIHFIHS